jgi:formylglycine-generating enzyme
MWKALGWVLLATWSCHSFGGHEHGVLGGSGEKDAGGEGNTAPWNGGERGAALPMEGGAGAGLAGMGGQGASGAEGGHGGQQPAGQGGGPECDEDVSCIPEAPCWIGRTSCRSGVAECFALEPAPGRTPCGSGNECTGDGTCIEVIASCVDQPIPGCGAITIQGGSFRMGWPGLTPEDPWQPVTVRTFAVDAYEVSVARFRRFWEAGHPVAAPATYPDGTIVRVERAPEEPAPTSENQLFNWSAQPAGREMHPINRVTWQTAFAFCAWDGGRLPTEAEWEYAASGREVDGLEPGRLYPWGDDEPTCALAQALDCPSANTVGVGGLVPHGGIFQMIGNVSEWTADAFEGYGGPCWDGTLKVDPLCSGPEGGTHVVRGSSFMSYHHPSIWRVGRSSLSGGRGIRCVRDPIE